jgi:hypothetical protein
MDQIFYIWQILEKKWEYNGTTSLFSSVIGKILSSCTLKTSERVRQCDEVGTFMTEYHLAGGRGFVVAILQC